MFNPKQLAIMMLQKNPEKANSPMGQQLIQALNSGNDQAGIAMADNILNAYGKTREQGMQEAMMGMFGRR